MSFSEDDLILKWIQRIWLFVLAPLMISIVFFAVNRQGMEGGLLILWTMPLFKLAAWPLGSVFSLIVSDDYIGRATGYSRAVDFLVLMIGPTLGAIQWFILIPRLFRRWGYEARQLFWIVWLVSIPVSLIVWLVLWLSS